MNKSKAGVIFIFITAALDMVGIGIVIPSLPDIMRRFVSSEIEVSEYFGYFISIYALMQFFASPLLGTISDLVGRRPVLLNSLLVGALDYVLMAFAPTLSLLFIGRAIAGLTGASLTVAMAYIADVSNDENRSSNFGLIGAAFGLGFIIGPGLGGFLGNYGPQYPFVCAAILNFLNFLFGLFILPESLPKSSRKVFYFKKINPFHSLFSILRPSHIFGLVIVHFLLQVAGQAHPSVWTLYTEHKFHWTAAQVGISLTVVGICMAITQGWFSRVFIPKLGEYKTLLWGILGQTMGFILYAYATHGWMTYAIIIGTSIFWVAPIALQAMITHKIPPHEQGEFQGSLVSLTSLASIITPLITTKLFGIFSQQGVNYFPGAPYIFAALVCFSSWIIVYRFKIQG